LLQTPRVGSATGIGTVTHRINRDYDITPRLQRHPLASEPRGCNARPGSRCHPRRHPHL